MSLLLAGLIIAGTSGAVAVGRWLSRRREISDETNPEAASASEAASGEAARKTADASTAPNKETKSPVARAAQGPHAHLDGFPCQLGDVLIRVTGEEAWLAGGLVLSEERPVAALFVAPEAVEDCAIYARPLPQEGVYWMAPLDPAALLVGGEPPSSIEHGGIRFERVRRLPLRPRRIGVGAPDVGDTVVLAEYASAGSERLLVMRGSSGVSHAYRGEELDRAAYEVIPSGKSTLGDD